MEEKKVNNALSQRSNKWRYTAAILLILALVGISFSFGCRPVPAVQPAPEARAPAPAAEEGVPEALLTVPVEPPGIEDTSPPMISQVNRSNVTTSTATISWTTDEDATSQVEYGPTAEYGSLSPLDDNLVTNHSVRIGNLVRGNTYHFRVISKDTAANETVSDDYMLATLSTPTQQIDPANGQVNTQVRVNGSGFTPEASYQVHFAYDTAFEFIQSGTVGVDGSIAQPIRVPEIPAGRYTIKIEDNTGNSTNSDFIVNPRVELSKPTAIVDDLITITGTGFTANKSVTLKYDGSSIETARSSTKGSFSESLRIPESEWGEHTVAATDGSYSATEKVSIQQTIKIEPPSGTEGTKISIQGTGFRSNRSVVLTFDNKQVTTTPSSVKTGSKGSFSASFNAPASASDTAEVGASDGKYEAIATFDLIASIRLNPSSDIEGATIEIKGSAFRPNRTISITYENEELTTNPASVKTNSVGQFALTFNVPDDFDRTTKLTASDGTNKAVTTFKLLASMSLDSDEGTVGKSVTIEGRGFDPRRTVTIAFDGFDVKTVTSDGDGDFNTSLEVPPSVSGPHEVRASDRSNTVKVGFDTLASMTMVPTQGAVSIEVTITGAGFAGNRVVNINFANISVGTVITDSNGSFSGKFVVPQLASGNYSVTISDGINQLTKVFGITTSISLSQTQGHVGMDLMVNGTGFSGAVTIKYDGTAIANTVADALGQFSAGLSVPPSKHGQHLIQVGDSVNTIETTFIVESDPPPAPGLILPENGSRQGSRPLFQWGPVQDPSGITYTLQVAKNSSFTTLLLEKKDLTVTQYELTSQQGLATTGEDAPYYWRVKAIDSAQNESNWSEARSFYVRFLPQWAIYVIIAAVAVAISVAATRKLYRRR